MALDPDSFNEQAMALFRAALDASAPQDNVLCSPLGIATALAAAQGPSPGLKAGPRASSDLEGLAACVKSLGLCDAVRLGNLLHANTALGDDYLALFEGSLGGKVRLMDASSQRAAPRVDIGDSTNSWASDLTDGAVTSVFSTDDLRPETDRAGASLPTADQSAQRTPFGQEKTRSLPDPQGSCLVNLVYLNSRWEEAFRRAGEQPFYAEPDRALMVPMMTQYSSDLPYLREPRFACVRLPYACPASQMALFLPALRAGGLEQELLPALSRWADVRAVLDKLVWTIDVTVTLPKVMLESPTIDLRKSIKSLNLKRPAPPNEACPGSEVKSVCPNDRATNTGADTPNATASKPSTTTVGSNDATKVFSYADFDDLWVDGLFHKATLDLTTRGGRSSPGFSALLSLCSTIPANEPVRFTVDRPFMFVVLKEDLLLMIGLVRNVLPKVVKGDDLKKYFI